MKASYLKLALIGGIGIVFLAVCLTFPHLRDHLIHTLKQPVSGWLLPIYF